MKFKKWLDEQTTTGAIALNVYKGGKHGGGVDVIGANCPDGMKWDKKKGKCVKSVSEAKKVPKEFMNDPLYKKVLTAKNKEEYDKALDTLKKIRGSSAVKSLKKAMSEAKEYKIPAKPLSTPEKHQLKIARSTLKMSDKMAKVMGGMSKKEAKKIIDRLRKEGKITEGIKSHRPLFKIAMEIGRDWKKVNFAAKPYLDAMSQLEFITDMYFLDPAREIVARFLANAGTWRGPVAKQIKAELKSMLKR